MKDIIIARLIYFMLFILYGCQPQPVNNINVSPQNDIHLSTEPLTGGYVEVQPSRDSLDKYTLIINANGDWVKFKADGSIFVNGKLLCQDSVLGEIMMFYVDSLIQPSKCMEDCDSVAIWKQFFRQHYKSPKKRKRDFNL